MPLHSKTINYLDHFDFFSKNWTSVHVHYTLIAKYFPNWAFFPIYTTWRMLKVKQGWWRLTSICPWEMQWTCALQRTEVHHNLREDNFTLASSNHHLLCRGGPPLCPHRWQQKKGGDVESPATSNRGQGSSGWMLLVRKVGTETFLSTITTENQRKQQHCWTMGRSSCLQPFRDPDNSRSRDSGSNLAWAWVTAQMNCFNKSALVN